ncbi:stretch-activated cation channel mid1 [Ascosphaera aggregata]|nr:stretch-activated cation channel mid1 [Ascosphaera aggregata]
MGPFAGQGVNMGLKDAADLSDTIEKIISLQKNKEAVEPLEVAERQASLLETYERDLHVRARWAWDLTYNNMRDITDCSGGTAQVAPRLFTRYILASLGEEERLFTKVILKPHLVPFNASTNSLLIDMIDTFSAYIPSLKSSRGITVSRKYQQAASIMLSHKKHSNALVSIFSILVFSQDVALNNVKGLISYKPDILQLLHGQANNVLYHNDDAQPLLFEDVVAPRGPPPGVQVLANNVPVKSNLKMGETQYYMVPKSLLSSPKQSPKGLPGFRRSKRSKLGGGIKHDVQQKSKTALYITATTCLQPRLKNPRNSSASASSLSSPPSTSSVSQGGAPQLSLFISTIEKPVNTENAEKIVFEEGYANVTLYPDDDIYIGVQAPHARDRQGIYNYHIAASIDENFHSVDASDPYLLFVDSDSTHALLWTNDTIHASRNSSLFQEWMHLKPPFTMFAQALTHHDRVAGLTHSHCGLSQNAVINGPDFFDAKMTDKGLNHQPKQQFYVRSLNSSTWYYGYLAMNGNSTHSGQGVAGGGGKVWAPMYFHTKIENNTALLYDLEFCDQVAYSVPANHKFNTTQLGKTYDSLAQERFSNFSKTLQVIPCEADPKGLYSLVSSCSNCSAAYKNWLCAITIPRASDYSDPRPWLHPKNVKQKFPNGTRLSSEHISNLPRSAHGSRNPMISKDIQPGPYKEVAPCQDLCWDMTMTCPAALGLKCPTGDFLHRSYGQRSDNGEVTCSYLGAAYNFNGATRRSSRDSIILTSLLIMVAFWISL